MKNTLRKFRFLGVFIFLLTTELIVCAQTYQWHQQFSGNLPNSSVGWDVATDASGNIYVVGQFRGTVNFGNGNVPADGYLDFFYAKYNASGTLLWIQNIGAQNCRVYGQSAALHVSGGTVYLYVSGGFNSINGQLLTVNFDPNGGSAGNLTMNDSQGDAFIAKYDLSNGGAFVWRTRIDNTADDFNSVGSLAADASGNVYHVNSGGGSSYMRKYNSSGTLGWTNSIGVQGYTSGANDVIVSSSNIYVCGLNLGSTPKPIAKYDLSGNLVSSFGNTNHNYNSIAWDNNSGLYVGGNNLTAQPDGTFVGIVNKYNSGTGNSVWSISYNSGLTGLPIDVSLNGTTPNEVIIAGWFKGTVNFNNGGGSNYTITSSGSGTHDNIFAARYNASTGSCKWVRNNPSNSLTGQSNPIAIASNSSYFHILGYVVGRTIDIDFCTGVTNVAADLADNGYIARYFIDSGASSIVINGPTLVCTTGSTYTLGNTPSGASYTWSASPSNFFASSSGTGSSAYLQALPGANGGATLTFDVNNSCGAPLTPITKSIWVGVAQSTSDMSYNLSANVPTEICASPGYPGEFYTYIYPFSTEYFEWESDAGDFSWTNPSYHFNGNNTTSNYLYFPTFPGEYPDRTIRVRAVNSCGASAWNTRYFDLTVSSDCSGGGGMGLSASPNPSSEYVDITLEGTSTKNELLDFEYSIEVFDGMGNKKTTLATNKRVSRMTLNGFKKGTYYVKAFVKDKLLSKRIFIE